MTTIMFLPLILATACLAGDTDPSPESSVDTTTSVVAVEASPEAPAPPEKISETTAQVPATAEEISETLAVAVDRVEEIDASIAKVDAIISALAEVEAFPHQPIPPPPE
jgi:hypothetical protein